MAACLFERGRKIAAAIELVLRKNLTEVTIPT